MIEKSSIIVFVILKSHIQSYDIHVEPNRINCKQIKILKEAIR